MMMSEPRPIALASGSNQGRHGYESAERIINGYIEDLGKNAKHRFGIYVCSGLALFLSSGVSGALRAAIVVGAKLYAVIDRQVFVIDQSGTATNIGGLPTDEPVYMAKNRREPSPEIGVVSAGLYYVIDTNVDSFTQNEDPDLPPASSITVINGHFILPGFGDKWFITAADDAHNIDGLDFAKAESSPDDTLRVMDLEQEALFFGQKTVEAWRYTGASFPFARTTSIELGCMAAGAVVKQDRYIVWVCDDGTVRQMEGYGGRIISNHDVERAISAETNKSGMTATAWIEDGHFFYALHGTSFTWQYDTRTKLWAERQSYNLNRWRVSQVVRFNNQLIAGDYTNGKLYTMKQGTYDENGEPLILTAQIPQVHLFPNGAIHDAIYLDAVPGVGLTTTDAVNRSPTVLIDYSKDGGKTWHGARQMTLGEQSKVKIRLRARKLGSDRFNARTYRFRAPADHAKAFLGAAISARKLAA